MVMTEMTQMTEMTVMTNAGCHRTLWCPGGTFRDGNCVGVTGQMLHEQDAIVEDTSTDVPTGQLGEPQLGSAS